MRLVLLSDTHTLHDQVIVPDGDVLVHAGDMGLAGTQDEIQLTLDWLNAQPHKHVVCIAGNHDWAFQKKVPVDLGRVEYLEDSSTNIDGLLFYGSPWQPEFCAWAFNVPRGHLKPYWDMIPETVDVLITHGPPHGVLDTSAPGKYAQTLGCEDLRIRVQDVKPKVHVFGHIHGGYGATERGETQYFNAAVCNERYRVTNVPWVVDLETR